MPTDWKDRIVSTPDVLRGTPRVKNTRIPVGLILGHLAAGSSFDQIIAEFPDLIPENVSACVDFGQMTRQAYDCNSI